MYLPETPWLDDPISKVRDLEHRVEAELLACLARGEFGVRGSGLYGGLSFGFDILSGVASCRWGCRGGSHGLENVVRRLVNGGLAAIRLAFGGYYDEALALIRVYAENVNLLQLFTEDSAQLAVWQTATERDHRRQFGPAEVRTRLDGRGSPPVYSSSDYSALCEAGVHLTPESARQSHDLERGRLFVGPLPSVPGVLLIWCELAVGLAGCLPRVTALAPVPVSVRESCIDAAEALTTAVGTGELRARAYDASLTWFRQQPTVSPRPCRPSAG